LRYTIATKRGLSRGFALLLAFACLFALPHTVLAAPRPATAIDAEWQKAYDVLKDMQDPVAKKLLFWITATQTDMPLETAALRDFMKHNAGWPRQSDLRRRIEENMADMPAGETAAWCAATAPETADGLQACLGALQKTGKTAEARRVLADFWKNATLDKKETSTLAASFRGLFTPGEHAERLDKLIWQGRYGEADAMLPLVGTDARALAKARLALARVQSDAQAFARR
jgi:soluble lytic murein transglycosylase